MITEKKVIIYEHMIKIPTINEINYIYFQLSNIILNAFLNSSIIYFIYMKGKLANTHGAIELGLMTQQYSIEC